MLRLILNSKVNTLVDLSEVRNFDNLIIIRFGFEDCSRLILSHSGSRIGIRLDGCGAAVFAAIL